MYLHLRGLCLDTNIDKLYVPMNKENSGSFVLVGLRSSIIKYDGIDFLWKLTDYYENTTATSNAPFASFELGSHEWMIENDASECPKGKKGILKLTGCSEGEFTCSNGQCIRQ